MANSIETSFEDFDKALQILNDLKQEGLIGDYAIGGAIATIYYTEPFFTEDLDIFTSLPETPSGVTILAPVYDFLEKRGYKPRGTYIDIGDTPIQFIPIPVGSTLEMEAIEKSKEITYKGIKTKVVPPEHLIAILLRAYRPKDREKIRLLLEQANVDVKSLEVILMKHHLWEKWLDFKRRNE